MTGASSASSSFVIEFLRLRGWAFFPPGSDALELLRARPERCLLGEADAIITMSSGGNPSQKTVTGESVEEEQYCSSSAAYCFTVRWSATFCLRCLASFRRASALSTRFCQFPRTIFREKKICQCAALVLPCECEARQGIFSNLFVLELCHHQNQTRETFHR